MLTSLIASTLLLIALIASPMLASPQATVDRIAAIVGDQVITLSDVRAAKDFGLVPDAGKQTDLQVLDRLIGRELMRAEVERFGAPDTPPEALEARARPVRDRFALPAAFKAALELHGLSEARFQAWLIDDLRIEAYVQQRFGAAAQPTDEEVLQYYQSREREFAVDGRPRPFDDVRDTVRQGLVDARVKAMVDDWVAGLARRTTVVRRIE